MEEVLIEQKQIDILRKKCENAQKRIWISSPYIGALKDVHKIIGGKWLLPSIDCRILTDKDNGFIRKDTFDEFLKYKVEIRSLESLHAKIYIVDDWCLVTSANLTGTAFFCRFEMGIASTNSEEILKTYDNWWKKAKPFTNYSKKVQNEIVEYQDGHIFKKKFNAIPYYTGRQDKYDALCEEYIKFAKLYEELTGRNPEMIEDGYTLLQEVDYFFNFLYHDHPDHPSNKQKMVRQLTESQRKENITNYFDDMCKYYPSNKQIWRLDNSKKIRNILDQNKIKKIGLTEVEDVVNCLHCQSSYPINRARFLNPKNNNINDIRDCWELLLHKGKINYSTIKYVTNKLNYFGLSSIYELIGWYNPDKYPIMNYNSHCGMRFFGYNV